MSDRTRIVASLVAALTCVAGCSNGGPAKPIHRERASERDASCLEPGRPHAYFYPAEGRTDYKPDHPDRDGCLLLVPDHLFCCPKAPRDTDR